MLVASSSRTRTELPKLIDLSTSSSPSNAPIQSADLGDHLTTTTSLTSASPAWAANAADSIRDRSATAHIKINRSRTSGLSIFRARANAPVSYASSLTLARPPRNAIKYGHWNSIHSRTSTRSVIHLAYAFLKLVRMPSGRGQGEGSDVAPSCYWSRSRD